MIKRKMTSAFALAAMMGMSTAFAVNPFSDVPSDSWAYQAVDQLATAGIINGIDITASQQEVENLIINVAAGNMTNVELAQWLRRNTIEININ